jgi:hypothetical protein
VSKGLKQLQIFLVLSHFTVAGILGELSRAYYNPNEDLIHFA